MVRKQHAFSPQAAAAAGVACLLAHHVQHALDNPAREARGDLHGRRCSVTC